MYSNDVRTYLYAIIWVIFVFKNFQKNYFIQLIFVQCKCVQTFNMQIFCYAHMHKFRTIGNVYIIRVSFYTYTEAINCSTTN